MISIANPLSILFWLGIYGSLVAKSLATASSSSLFIHSLAVIFGLILWDIGMAFVASSFRHLLSRKTIARISFVSGLCLVGFGLYFGYEAYLEISSW